jgi:hypothetical protein
MSMMEKCGSNKQCRANEKKVSEVHKGVEYCCCDTVKEAPPPTDTSPKLIAPKCYYDKDGNIIPYSTLMAGVDLVCENADQMMTYTDEKDPQSCCILKDMTTIPTTTVPPGTRELEFSEGIF